LGKAFIEIRTGRLDDAAAALDALEKLDPTPDAAALATRSVLERRRGDELRAKELEQHARRLDPGAASWAIESASKAAK
jgi:predicted Zn-dependent protease